MQRSTEMYTSMHGNKMVSVTSYRVTMCVDSIWKVLIGKCGKRMETSVAIQPVWGKCGTCGYGCIFFFVVVFFN